MKRIYGIGLSRTGTTSLTTMLKKAGIHMIHYPREKQLFSPKIEGACDIPVALYFKDLDKKFPNSKFVYTIREKNEWLISIEKHFSRKNLEHSLVGWRRQNRIALYGQLEFDKGLFSKKYDEHDRNIKAYFKGREKDLLILNICGGESPEKLFSFVGITDNVPQNFPHNNKERVRK